MSLSVRAAHAYRQACEADPDYGREELLGHVGALRARYVRELAGLLGIDPGHVVAVDDPARAYGACGHLLIVTDPEPHPPAVRAADQPDEHETSGAGPRRYRFIPDLAQPDTFRLLGTCPGCGAEVATARIGQLADLGLALAPGVTPAPDPWDANHAPLCPLHRTD